MLMHPAYSGLVKLIRQFNFEVFLKVLPHIRVAYGQERMVFPLEDNEIGLQFKPFLLGIEIVNVVTKNFFFQQLC